MKNLTHKTIGLVTLLLLLIFSSVTPGFAIRPMNHFHDLVAGEGCAPWQAAAVAAVKVASIDDGPRRHRIRETGGTAGPGGPSLPGDITCHEDPTKPEPVYKKDIEYTASARAEGIEGKLKLKLTVGADGQVINVEVLSAVAPELDAAAVAAVKLWRFKPAMMCGKAVSGGVYIVARRFELGD